MPKDILPHPRLPELEALFRDHEAPLREGGTVPVTRLPWSEGLRESLRQILHTGHLTQGLEQIAQTLDREEKGLRAVREKTAQAPAQRLSRLLILSSDGSERFYRDAESVLTRNADRAWGCLVAVTSAELGEALTAKGNPAKALLIGDREALGLFLKGLADGL